MGVVYSSVLGRYANGVESHRSDPSFYAKRCEKIVGRELGKGGCFDPVCLYLQLAATGVLADALWKDEGTPAPCGWKILSGKFGFRLVDHEGRVGFSGKEDEVQEKYAEFCDWYETVLLPAILDEKVS